MTPGPDRTDADLHAADLEPPAPGRLANGLGGIDRRLVRRSEASRRRLWSRLSLRAARAGLGLTCEAPLFFGDTVVVRTTDVVGALIHRHGTWEPQLTRVVEQALAPGDVFVDVGANIGYWSLLAAHLVGPTGRVVAIEASPSIHAELVANIQRNGHRNVEALNVAVTDAPGTVDIHLGPSGNRGVTSIHAGRGHRREATVRADSLANLLDADAVRRCKVLKVDVEGAEDLVVAGMGSMISHLPDDCRVLLEVDLDRQRERGSNASDLLAPFLEAGFTVQRLRNNYQAGFYRADHTEVRPLPFDLDEDHGMRDLLLTRP